MWPFGKYLDLNKIEIHPNLLATGATPPTRRSCPPTTWKCLNGLGFIQGTGFWLGTIVTVAALPPE